ncbi:hypothetical protein EYF80_015267 [Liparis tanakae]|uniref:Uncharacterized protein n=1 Tax=Liparis tanakae TaxID=230148 RepID=A0A4Z2I922_9TELE|nr:hypothetical protein EYF80_015267 [Liparis tanakae]
MVRAAGGGGLSVCPRAHGHICLRGHTATISDPRPPLGGPPLTLAAAPVLGQFIHQELTSRSDHRETEETINYKKSPEYSKISFSQDSNSLEDEEYVLFRGQSSDEEKKSFSNAALHHVSAERSLLGHGGKVQLHHWQWCSPAASGLTCFNPRDWTSFPDKRKMGRWIIVYLFPMSNFCWEKVKVPSPARALGERRQRPPVRFGQQPQDVRHVRQTAFYSAAG